MSGRTTTERNDMADEDGQVDGADGAVARENHIPVERMVGDVADEKQRREGEGGHHRGAMAADLAMANEVKTGQQRDDAKAVQDSIQRGQKHQALGILRRRVMHVDQPQQQAYGGGAEQHNSDDGNPCADGRVGG